MRPARNRLIPALLLAVLGMVTSDGQTQTLWTPLAFDGGPVPALVAHPTTGTLYAATLGRGVGISTDGGRSWELSSTGMADTRVLSLALDPNGHLYAGTQSQGVYVTRNGGDTWDHVNIGLPLYSDETGGVYHRPITALGIRPTPPFLGLALTSGGIYRSLDDGQSWVPSNTGMEPQAQSDGVFLFDTVDPDRILFGHHTNSGSNHHWVYVSTDGGVHWSPSESGMFPDDRPVLALYSVPSNSSKMYLGLKAALGQPSIYRSVDRGLTWVTADTGLPPGVSVSAFLEDGPRLLAGTGARTCTGSQGIFLTDDADPTWELLSADLASTPISALVTNGQDVFAATGSSQSLHCGRGVFRAVDSGQRWEAASWKLQNQSILAVAIDPDDQRNYLVATGDGKLHYSSDSGNSWTAIQGDLPPGKPTQVAILSGTPKTILAVLSIGAFAGLYETTDLGLNWEDRSGSGSQSLPSDETFTSLQVLGPGSYLVSASRGVFRTSDGGASWVEEDQGIQQEIPNREFVTALAVDGPMKFAAGTNSEGIYLSDGNGTWVDDSSSLPSGPQGLDAITSLLWDRTQVEKLMAGTSRSGFWMQPNEDVPWIASNAGLIEINNFFGPIQAMVQRPDPNTTLLMGFGIMPEGLAPGLFRSDDQGASWRPITPGVPKTGITSLALGGPDGSRVLLGTDGAGIVVSVDGALTFQDISPFGGLTPQLTKLVVDPNEPANVWASTQQRGVFRSTDGGRTFQPFNTDLPQTEIFDLVFFPGVTPFQSVLYAATADGLFQSARGTSDWTALTAGLPTGPVRTLLLASSPPDTGTLWAAVEGQGLYVLQPTMPSFVSTGLTETVVTLQREESTGLLLAGTETNGVFESLNGLDNWFAVNTGLPTDAFEITDLELAPPQALRSRQTQEILWAGSVRRGVYRYRPARNRGETLVWEDTGLGNLDVRALRFIPEVDTLYAATDQGLWKLQPAVEDGGTWSIVEGLPDDPQVRSCLALRRARIQLDQSLELLVLTEAGPFRIEISLARPVPGSVAAMLLALAGWAGVWGSVRIARGRSRSSPGR